MELEALRQQALELADRFDRLNAAQGQQPWGPKDLMLGLSGDVGDLAKAIQVAENARTLPGTSIEHELADCLWSLLVLADRYGIDLEQAFTTLVDGMGERVEAKIAEIESEPS
ncbi:MazG nucleotide pyrophosphohydrolase domain-containing protein [Glycomyces paridis]|uniref:Nucleotide pyrophosphohydrolase n=1 Tax=Glycomyces paridis TaxID=2126555 RepID=A0A4S8PNL9_9ACTN|nr:MazG nucleotide pyrophosphohydrolase domain-containing protein [Glycomyces paridis]THV29974.1 nucleotide pyrophosphohydrolase [Glycomyces paridis]